MSRLFRVVRRAEFQCAACGYDLGAAEIFVCPECGGAARAPRSARALEYVIRASRHALPIAGGLFMTTVAVWAGVRFTVGSNVRLFLDSYARDSSRVSTTSGGGLQQETLNAWNPFPGDSPRGILITLTPWARERETALVIEVTAPMTTPPFVAPATSGDPYIFATLTSEQASRLLARVDRDALLRRFQEVAEEWGWRPNPGAVLPGGIGVPSSTKRVDLDDLLGDATR